MRSGEVRWCVRGREWWRIRLEVVDDCRRMSKIHCVWEFVICCRIESDDPRFKANPMDFIELCCNEFGCVSAFLLFSCRFGVVAFVRASCYAFYAGSHLPGVHVWLGLMSVALCNCAWIVLMMSFLVYAGILAVGGSLPFRRFDVGFWRVDFSIFSLVDSSLVACCAAL